MNNAEIINLNKMIRNYGGKNTFVLSLQKNLKTSRTYFKHNNRNYKRLSDKQYEAFKNITHE